MTRRLPVVAICSYIIRYLISLGKPANDDVSSVLFGWREATTGDTVCLLSQGTPSRSSMIFFFTLYKADIAVPVPMVS